jgi:sugar/nucleoside kinase (ribokinase family)
MKKILEIERIDTSNIITKQNYPAKVVVALTDTKGNHVFLSKIFTELPHQTLTSTWKKAIETSEGLMIVGYSLLENQMRDALIKSMKLIKDVGKPVFFDPGPLCNQIPEKILNEALSNSEVILLTEEELGLIFEGDVSSICNKLFEIGIKMICIKQGPQGCRLITKDDDVSCPGFPVNVLDTNGAGDSFAAAFVFGYLSKWPLKEIGTFANLMGAVKVKKIGSGRNVPTIDELKSEMIDQKISLNYFE